MNHRNAYLLAIDQGTTSSRSLIFNELGQIVSMAQKPFRQFYPEPGWVEQDAQAIWQGVEHCMREVIAQAGIKGD